MKILKIDHLGIAVNSTEAGKNFWSGILGLDFEGDETVAAQKVKTAFFPVGESEVELLESTAPDGPIARFIEKNGQGIHHFAILVDSIEDKVKSMQAQGARLIGDKAAVGADNMKIIFVHPKSTNGVLLELCEPLAKEEK